MTILVWLRAALRVADNETLASAVRAAPGRVRALYLATPETWAAHGDSAAKIDLVGRTLRVLRDELAARGVPLEVAEVPRFDDAPAAVVASARRSGAGAVHFDAQYEIDEHRRDVETIARLRRAGIEARVFHDQVILPPGSVLTRAGEPYTVFTPFRRA